MKKIVILGAAGRTGRLIVDEALRAGHQVTATARTAKNFSAGVRVAAADIRDPRGLAEVFAGNDVVVSAIGAPGRKALGLYADGARATVTAMREAGVRRYLGITSVGVRHDDPNFSWWYRSLVRPIGNDLYTDMKRMEETFRATDLDWTFVRPTYLQDRKPTDDYRVTDGTNPPGGWKITRADVARFIVEEIGRNQYVRQAPSLAE